MSDIATADEQTLSSHDFPRGLRGLVFDIDGVLFDSRSSNMVYYNSIRKAVGLPPLSREEEDYCQMASVTESFEAVIPPELREAAWRACDSINYQRDILPMLSPEPGLLEMLHWLKQHSVPCAIFPTGVPLWMNCCIFSAWSPFFPR